MKILLCVANAKTLKLLKLVCNLQNLRCKGVKKRIFPTWKYCVVLWSLLYIDGMQWGGIFNSAFWQWKQFSWQSLAYAYYHFLVNTFHILTTISCIQCILFIHEYFEESLHFILSKGWRFSWMYWSLKWWEVVRE